MKKLPIGASDFKKLRTENKYFADKSLFIKEIIEEDAEIVLLPRPRRFGKTLNLTMLRYFLEKTDKPEETKKLFSGLAIEKEGIFEEHICRYPVIYLTFKDIKASNFEHSLKSIKRLIAREYRRHSYLLTSEQLEDFDKEDFQSILSVKADISLFENSLLDLSHYLYKHYKEKPVILIDEYDTPIISAYAEGYYKETINFFKSFLGAGLKDNPNIYKGVMTGILRVAKESIFSDMNNLGVYSLLRSKFSDKFGLTEEEVFSLLQYYKEENKIKSVREWYNGYIFGGNTIYNPWSIINYAANI
ncbi:MAG: AAA family ATPase, partial [Desulfobacula sp.]|nr:AAA family ATPase [Desulfobacula sp.]